MAGEECGRGAIDCDLDCLRRRCLALANQIIALGLVSGMRLLAADVPLVVINQLDVLSRRQELIGRKKGRRTGWAGPKPKLLGQKCSVE